MRRYRHARRGKKDNIAEYSKLDCIRWEPLERRAGMYIFEGHPRDAACNIGKPWTLRNPCHLVYSLLRVARCTVWQMVACLK